MVLSNKQLKKIVNYADVNVMLFTVLMFTEKDKKIWICVRLITIEAENLLTGNVIVLLCTVAIHFSKIYISFL